MASMMSQFLLERYALSAATASTSSRGSALRSLPSCGESPASPSVTSMLGIALRILVTAAWSFNQSLRLVLSGLGSHHLMYLLVLKPVASTATWDSPFLAVVQSLGSNLSGRILEEASSSSIWCCDQARRG